MGLSECVCVYVCVFLFGLWYWWFSSIDLSNLQVSSGWFRYSSCQIINDLYIIQWVTPGLWCDTKPPPLYSHFVRSSLRPFCFVNCGLFYFLYILHFPIPVCFVFTSDLCDRTRAPIICVFKFVFTKVFFSSNSKFPGFKVFHRAY